MDGGGKGFLKKREKKFILSWKTGGLCLTDRTPLGLIGGGGEL